MTTSTLTECAGLTALWCPVHGSCCCRGYWYRQDLLFGAVSGEMWVRSDYPGQTSGDDLWCPLHSPLDSDHAEVRPVVDTAPL